MNADRSSREPAGLPLPFLVDPVSVVRDMLATLETLTSVGQQYLMGKILRVSEDHARVLLGGMSPRNRRAVMGLLTHLRGECDRFVPDVATFVRRADRLTRLLGGGRRPIRTWLVPSARSICRHYGRRVFAICSALWRRKHARTAPEGPRSMLERCLLMVGLVGGPE
jgi:hypothetical protein